MLGLKLKVEMMLEAVTCRWSLSWQLSQHLTALPRRVGCTRRPSKRRGGARPPTSLRSHRQANS